ncbi:MAG: ECF-type sigma factor [Rhodothermales bacterium]
MSSDPNSVTAYLQQAREGDAAAFDRLFALVYQELQHLAHKVRSDRPGAEMSTMSLVHEAYVKLLPSQHMAWNDRLHFYRVAARAMRQLLVNAAEQKATQKRGGDVLHVTLTELNAPKRRSFEHLIVLNDALNRLERMSPRQAQIVEYRVFGGFTIAETAKMIGVSPITVRREWAAARAWLSVQMSAS